MKTTATHDDDTPISGPIALIADRGELGPVVVSAREGPRITFHRPDGTWQKAGAQRLFFEGAARAEALSDLEPFFAACTEAAGSVDLAAAHASAAGQGALSAAEMAAVVGLPAADWSGYVLACAVFGDGLYFKLRDGRFTPESAADVARNLARLDAERRLAEAVEAAATHVLARLRDRLNALPPALEEALVEVAALGRESDSAPLAEGLLAALQVHLGEDDGALPPSCRADSTMRVLSRQVEELLITLGLLERHANLAPIRAGVPTRFTPELLAEAGRVQAAPPWPAPELDLTHLEAFAIDDPETTEIDDAIALDPEIPGRVHILIADAAAYVPPGSPLDVEAARRLTTLYLPDGRIPMLPPALAEGGASLVADVPRTAVVFSATLDASGRPMDLDVVRARVRVRHQISYDDAFTLLGSHDSAAGGRLRDLEALALRHRTFRHAAGAVTFQRPEVNFHLLPSGRIELKVGAPLSRARQLVAELMVLACHAAAELCAARGIPCLFRSQAAPDELPGPPDPVTGRIDDPVLQNELMRRLKPSVLSTDPRLHWTLGVPSYTQVTSPIRRYTDLVVHQQLLGALVPGYAARSTAELDALIADIGRQMASVRRADQESRRLFALRWFEQEEGRVFDAVVLRELGKRYLVDLGLLGWHEAIHLRGRRRPGQQVRLKVDHVDIEGDSISFREV